MFFNSFCLRVKIFRKKYLIQIDRNLMKNLILIAKLHFKLKNTSEGYDLRKAINTNCLNLNEPESKRKILNTELKDTQLKL